MSCYRRCVNSTLCKASPGLRIRKAGQARPGSLSASTGLLQTDALGRVIARPARVGVPAPAAVKYSSGYVLHRSNRRPRLHRHFGELPDACLVGADRNLTHL